MRTKSLILVSVLMALIAFGLGFVIGMEESGMTRPTESLSSPVPKNLRYKNKLGNFSFEVPVGFVVVRTPESEGGRQDTLEIYEPDPLNPSIGLAGGGLFSVFSLRVSQKLETQSIEMC